MCRESRAGTTFSRILPAHGKWLVQYFYKLDTGAGYTQQELLFSDFDEHYFFSWSDGHGGKNLHICMRGHGKSLQSLKYDYQDCNSQQHQYQTDYCFDCITSPQTGSFDLGENLWNMQEARYGSQYTQAPTCTWRKTIFEKMKRLD